MRRWKPQPGLARWLGLAALVAAGAGSGLLGLRLWAVLTQPPASWPVDLQLYGLVLAFLALLFVTALLIYRVASSLTMAYEIDRNGLYISWIGNRLVVPLERIENLERGSSGLPMPWWILPGIGSYQGRVRMRDGRTLNLFATRAPRAALLVTAGDQAYIISPNDTDSFVQDLEQRRRLGAVKPLTPTFEPSRLFFYAFWRDPMVRWAIIGACGLNLLLLGFLATRYPGLSEAIALRFTATGEVAELRPRHQVLFLPLAALTLLLLNTGLGMSLYNRTADGARLLQLGSALVQIFFAVAALTIVVWNV